MAIFTASTSFKLDNLNLNDMFANYSSENLSTGTGLTSDPVNFNRGYLGLNLSYSFAGQSLDNLYTVFWNASQMSTSFGGVNFAFNVWGYATAGTVHFVGNYANDGAGNFTSEWALTDFSGNLVDIQAAAQTASTADDMSIIASILSGNDLISLSNGNDAISGFGGDDIIAGMGGNDRLYGFTGNDTISGGAGRDHLYGWTGNDLLQGDGGNDYINGGKGRDAVVFDNSSEASPSDVTVDLRITTGQATGYGTDTIVNVENIIGGVGNDRLTGDNGRNAIAGGNGNDRLVGLGGKDALFGMNGRDKILGGKGNDELSGGNGNDRIIAGSGHDHISGGHGNDRLTGNGGVDQFIFHAGDGQDRITDFSSGTDVLALSLTLWSGTMAAADIVNTYASINLASGNVEFNFDGGEAITLDGVTTIAGLASDILIV